MRIPISTAVAVVKRLEREAVPRFFDDRWSLARVRARRRRVDRWLGGIGCILVAEHDRYPTAADRTLKRRQGTFIP